MTSGNSVRPKTPHFFYGWVVVATAFLVNVVAAPMNAVVVAFFVNPQARLWMQVVVLVRGL